MCTGSRELNPYLAGSVNDFRCIFLALVLDDTTECVLDGRIVAFYKVPFDELDGERRFSCRKMNNWTLVGRNGKVVAGA